MLGLAHCGAWLTPSSLRCHPPRPRRRHHPLLSPISSARSQAAGSGDDDDDDDVNRQTSTPQRVVVQLKKPLGLTLEETPTGQIIVASVIAGSNAERSGRICQGMRLIATSAVIYKSEKDYGGVAVKGEQEIIRLAVAGERFETVVAAIGAHPGFIPVTLELEQLDPQEGGEE